MYQYTTLNSSHDNQSYGINHIVNLTIAAGGMEINTYKHFELEQSTETHHRFKLTLSHDSLGKPEDFQMEQLQKLFGKSIFVTFSYRNVANSPERHFHGTITDVGLSMEGRSHGDIIISGYSPTILLDQLPSLQSFGGDEAISLEAIAGYVIRQGFSSFDYNTRVNAKFGKVTYSCQYAETHYNYLARLAFSYGEQFYYDGLTLHFGQLPENPKPITLVLGKNVSKLETRMKLLNVRPLYYSYHSGSNECLHTAASKIEHVSTLGKKAYELAKQFFKIFTIGVAPVKAHTTKDIDAAQNGASGSAAVRTYVTTGQTSVPFLHPGCVVDMNTLSADGKETDYLTQLMVIKINHTVDARGNYKGEFEAIAANTGYLPKPQFIETKAEIQPAKVINNQDPLNLGRVQIRFYWQLDSDHSDWIRVMAPDAGSSEKVSKNRGFLSIPEVGDQVMVGFVHNHPDKPFALGSMFHGKIAAGGGKGNKIKSFSSKSGNKLELNDEKGSVFLTDKGTANIKLDGAGNATTNAHANHNINAGHKHSVNVGATKEQPPQASLHMDADGNLVLEGKTSIALKVDGNTLIINKDGIKLQSAEGTIDLITLIGALSLNSKGPLDISTESELSVNASASAQISSSDTNIM